ncbi:MAG: hypothetical protein IT285_12410 [Bdellovibrionales bacterium]|nr:hypothetical protein [Bdellovibrionales bacterium]
MKTKRFYWFAAVLGLLMSAVSWADMPAAPGLPAQFKLARVGGLKGVASGERSGYQRASRELEKRYAQVNLEIVQAVDRLVVWGTPGTANRQIAVKGTY